MQQVIREAIIINVDRKKQTCTLDYGDGRASETSMEVPLPNFIGSGNNGLINILKPGTRVLVAFLGIWGRNIVSILGVLPSFSQGNNVANSSGLSSDLPPGSRKYPIIKPGEVLLSSHSGPFLYLKEDRELSLVDPLGRGIHYKFRDGSHSVEFATNNNIYFNSAGRLFWGEVRRNEKYIVSPDDNNSINYNSNILNLTRNVGFFSNSTGANNPNGNTKRNLNLSEYRMVINEFSSDSQFSGFEDEYSRINKELEYLERNEKNKRYLDPTNLIGLSQKELIEVVAGNLIDINSRPLDINYNYMVIGGPGGGIPNNKEDYIDAVRKSRRGIGYHFQLNSSSFKSDTPSNIKNFSFDIDKEGAFKIHVPKTSETGNIFYPIISNYEAGKDVTVIATRPYNQSVRKPIPVTLRDSNGNPVFELSSIDTHRYSGVRYENKDPNPYFKGTEDSVRINKTKYHNIYEIAERLLANRVTEINIPTTFVQLDDKGDPKLFKDPDFLGYSYSNRPFEVVKNNDKDEKFDYGYSTLTVNPDPPAIKTGGKTFFAGKNVLELSEKDLAQSNYYKTKITDNKASLAASTPGQVSPGGVSANMDFEGSIEVSVGVDDADKKSIVLDTAGSLLIWLGKDDNNKSLIFQSDGEVLFNIGGSYSDDTSFNPTLNKGRFDLRVNVTNRGFYSPEIPTPSKTESVGECDYIISISEEGMVIAGGTKKPLLLKNKGEIMIESESTVSLFGKEINFITPGREPVPFTKFSKNKQR